MHINMDSGISEDTKFKRIVGANLLIPYATAIFANSYVRKNDAKPIKSYRSKIWQHLDETRTGILPLSKALQSMSIKDLCMQIITYMGVILHNLAIINNNYTLALINQIYVIISIALKTFGNKFVMGTKPKRFGESGALF